MNPEWCPDSADHRHHWPRYDSGVCSAPRFGYERGLTVVIFTTWCKHCSRPAIVKLIRETCEGFIRLL